MKHPKTNQLVDSLISEDDPSMANVPEDFRAQVEQIITNGESGDVGVLNDETEGTIGREATLMLANYLDSLYDIEDGADSAIAELAGGEPEEWFDLP